MFSFLKPAFNIFKKVLLVVIVYFAVISLFSHFISKDKIALNTSKTNPILENRAEIYKVINDKELNKTTQGKLTIFMYKGMMCSMMGEACTNNPADADKNYGKSFLGFVSNLIVLPFANPPASGIAWTYSGLANAGFVPKTLAAEGIGMGSIQPFAKIWKIFRDVTYLLLVVVLIAIGFMVMFRTKINPQTVISVENSLPKIIMALILITFSFAIAGFLIDLMYMLIAVIISILGRPEVYNFGIGFGGTGLKNTTELQQYYLQAGPAQIYKGLGKLNDSMWGTMLYSLPNSILTIIPELGFWIRLIGGGLITFIGAGVIDKVIHFPANFLMDISLMGSAEATTGVGGTIKLGELIKGIATPWQFIGFVLILIFIFIYLIPLILGLLILTSLIFIFFKIIFLLISSYIKILLSIILAPIYLLFEAVPGQSAFANWIKNLAGELITFPLVVGIFVLGTIISDAASAGNLVEFPFLVGIDPKAFGMIIGMMLLFMTPDLVKAVRGIFIPKPGLLDQAGPGVFFGGVGAAVGGGMGAMGQFGSMSLAIGALGPSGVFAGLGKKLGLSRFLGPYTKPSEPAGNVTEAANK